jgi:hypothetical protein
MYGSILTSTTTKLILAYKIEQSRTNSYGLSSDLRRSNGFGIELSIWDIGIAKKLCCHVSHLLKAKLLQLFFWFF